MISFIVPAHNEEAYLGATLRAIHEAARPSGKSYEIIVVNDASTDDTAPIARQAGAKVLDVNLRKISVVRNAGAREVHLRISCPPTVSPCFYGVDTPRQSELIAANQSVEEIREFVEADSLAYLSLDALRRAVADDQNQYCYACYTGDYPTELVHIEELVAAKGRRR